MARGPRIVIAGGGFGGLYAALYLSRSYERPRGMEITLVDRKNFFTFTPLLTEVAGGALGREHVSQPYRLFARAGDFEFLQACVRGLDPEERVLHTDVRPLHYDYLVLALGGEPRFFGLDEVREAALPFQTLRDALTLRNRVMGLVERIAHTTDVERKRAMATFVIAGGGPAGTEVASELRQLLCDILPDYYRIDVPVRIVLVEAGDEILAGFDPGLAGEGRRILERRGVEVRVGCRVTGYRDGRALLSDGMQVRAGTLVWAAGVAPSRVIEASGLPTTERGAVRVNRYLCVEGWPEIYAIGDCNHLKNPRTDEPYPRVAPIAINQAIRAAGNIENALVDRALEPYEAHYAGKIVSLGAGEALIETLGFRWTGRPAWWMYRLVYLLKLVGTKPKIRVGVTLALNRLFERDLSCEVEAGEPLPGGPPRALR